MATLQEALNIALQHHQSGRLAEAETIYRRILEVDESQPAPLQLLGALCLQQKRIPEAIQHLSASVGIEPTPEGFDNLGGAYLASGRLNESETAFRSALQLSPNVAKYHFDLGTCLKQMGRTDEAIASFQTAVKLQPNFIQALNNLGTTLNTDGRSAEAVEAFQAALAIKPDYGNALNGLGNALLNLGQTDEALKALQRSTELNPRESKFHCNFGVALKATGRFEEALAAYRTSVQLDPSSVEARRNLGNLFINQHQPENAAAEFESAAQINPDDPRLHVAIGDCYRDLQQFERARLNYDAAIQLQPQDCWLKRRSGFLCPSVFNSNSEIDDYRATLQQNLDEWQQTPGVLDLTLLETVAIMPPFGLPYHGRNDRSIKESIARLYSPSFTEYSNRKVSLPTDRAPRIGFLVTNGHQGIFLRCMAGILDRLSREEFTICVAAPTAAMAAIREKLSNPDTELIELPDRFEPMIAILQSASFDLLYFWECGTDLFNYFLPFIRLAPVQCTGWGLPVTSGIPAMDYYLSSRSAEPNNAAEHYSEQLVQAESLLTWQDPIEVPQNAASHDEFGFAATDHIYLCAQNLMKIHPDFDEILSAILDRDSQSKIVLVEDGHVDLSQMLQQRFAESMPETHNRIRILPRMPFDRYLELVSLANVALDPLHYGSGITAYEILACGTPIVTMPGEFRRGRFVSACYSKMGVEDCVANSSREYVDLACQIAESKDHRSSITSAILEHRMVLFEDQQAVHDFESSLRAMLSWK